MKTGSIDRSLLTVYTLIIILGSMFILLVCAGVGLGIISLEAIRDYASNINWNWQIIAISSAIAILFIIVSIRLLFLGVRKPALHSALLKNTELGMIRVSRVTLETLAQKAVKSFGEIKDAKSIIILDMEGIRVHIKILVMPDVKLPELTVSIQQKVKDYIESLSGIVVKEVQIYVDNLAAAQKI